MVYLLHGHERTNHPSLFAKMFELRHKVFVQSRGWSLPSRNTQEIDQYDKPDAVYFVDLDDDGLVQAHFRMTPTLTSSLSADLFPFLFENGVDPRSPTIYEATRWIVRPSKPGSHELRAVKARLMAAGIEWCMKQGITHMQTIIDAGTLKSFVEVSILTTPMGLSHPYGGGKSAPGGGECLVFRWPIGDALLGDVKAYGGITVTQSWQQIPAKAA